VVAVTTVLTFHTQAANFWADFEHNYRRGNKQVAKRLWACVKAERLHFKHL